MLIKFKAPDPRAGSVVQMDSSRGQHFIDAGAAVRVEENEADTPVDVAGSTASPVTAGAATPAKAPRAKK